MNDIIPGSLTIKNLLPGVILHLSAVNRQLLFIAAIISTPAAVTSQKTPDLEKSIVSASDLLRGGEVRKAEVAFRAMLNSATKRGDDRFAARCRVGLSASYLAIHDYKAAAQNGQKALEYALTQKDADIAVRAALNLSSVYRRMGDYRAATQTMRDLNPILSQVTDSGAKMQLYIHAATNYARNGDWARAEPLFYAGIDLALNRGDLQTAASGWNQLGYMRLQANDLPNAEAALTEAFRLRRSAGNRNLGVSYAYLGMLRLTQGDARSSLNLLNRAVEIASAGVPLPVAVVYYWRAKARSATSDTRGALEDFDRAIRWATQWRHEILPSDGFRITAEVALDNMYDQYVNIGMHAAGEVKGPLLARRMFEVSEQHKSASFRELLRTGLQLPAEYWEALANYRAALASSSGPESTGPADQARLQLAQIESSLGLESAKEGSAQVRDVQRQLRPEEALISFHIGQDQSYVWAITRDGFEWHVVPGLGRIAPLAKQYINAVTSGSALNESNIQLYDMLFSGLTPRILAKRDWLLSLDRGLFEIPFAALGPTREPLILSHSLRTIPGAALLSRPASPNSNSRFVGAGDAIYNAADPRWTGSRAIKTTQFSRLVNTRQEIRTVARAWGADAEPKLLFGDAFSRSSLQQTLRSGAGIVHIAAHVVKGRDPGQIMIGVGLNQDGREDFLTPADISSQAVRVGLVSINGCASGGGVALPGAGLIGLTRAWLLSGATAVAATYWPVNDDRGELFSRMYSELARSPDRTITASKAAKTLQIAQIACWRSNMARSKPGYWAAVFVAGKH
jgi:CHAT domain-containing protein